MPKIKGSFAGAGVLALGYTLSACSATDVSAGSEGDAINLNRCYGADCGQRAQSLRADEPQALPCGDVVGPLADRLTFEAIADDIQARALHAQETSDGSVWAIQSVTTLQDASASLYLTHHSSDGTLLGVSDAIESEREHTLLDAALAVDVNGVVTVGVYSIYAETADSDLVERLTLHSFDSDFHPVGLPRAFRGVAKPHMVGGPLGSIWLAGNAAGNAKHGAISRLTGNEPRWIQTAVPTSGQSVIGVSGLAVADDGFAAVVAQLNPKWSGRGPDVVKLGLATFDEAGKPLWTLALPTDYTPGYGGGLGITATGDLVVAGMVGQEGQDLLIQSVSREGALGWSYSVEGAQGPSIDVRRDSGRTFAGSWRGLAVIDAAGEGCRLFSIPFETDDVAPWSADAEYVLATGGELTRMRVPE